MNNARKILSGTLILTAASILMQTVGVSWNVWLTARAATRWAPLATEWAS